jgi:hypothetical protein
MVLARLPGVIRPANRFKASSRADFAMRGFAISFLTLARVASLDSFLVVFFFIERLHDDFEAAATQFNLEARPQFAAHTSMPGLGVASPQPGQN